MALSEVGAIESSNQRDVTSTGLHSLPLVAEGQKDCRWQGQELRGQGRGDCTGPTGDDEGWSRVGTMDVVRNGGILEFTVWGTKDK